MVAEGMHSSSIFDCAIKVWFAKIEIDFQVKELADPPRLGLSPYDTDLC
jgi:hypothetical protein